MLKKWQLRSHLKSLREFWHQYRRNKNGVLGLFLTASFVILAVIGPLIAPYNPIQISTAAVQPPSWEHLMGTDDIGRDIFSGVLFGARVSFGVGVVAALMAALIGTIIGGAAGYYGGMLDEILMRITDFFLTLPRLLFLTALSAIYGPNIVVFTLFLGLTAWRQTARVVRGEFLTLREREYVEAAKLCRQSSFNIIFSEILPSVIPMIVVVTTLQVAEAILIEAAVSFMGLGDPTAMSLGYMMYRAQKIYFSAWWTEVFPGLLIFIGTLGVNALGEGLNVAFNPRYRER